MNWNFFQQLSFKTRVTATTLAIFLLGIWSLAIYGSRLLYADLERLLTAQQFSAASYVAADINGQFTERFDALNLIARAIDQPLMENPAALQQFLEQRFVLHSLFSGGVIAYRVDNTAIAEFPRMGRVGINYSDRDSVVSAIQQGKSSLSRPAVGKKLQNPMFLMTVPIHDGQGGVMGALSGVVDLSHPNFLSRITENRYGISGGYLLISKPHRLIVTATEKSRIMETLPAPGISPLIDRFVQGYEGTDIFVNPVGLEVLVSAKGIPAAGWYAAVMLPTTEAFAPVRDIQQQILLATLLLTMVAGVLTWWSLRRQLSPMLSAAQTLTEMSRSESPPEPLPIVRKDEVGELIAGFNRLLEILIQREAALHASEMRFRSLMENTPNIAVQGYAPDGTVTFWNHASEQLYGYTTAEAMGSNLLDLIIPAEMSEAVKEAMRKMFETGEPIPASELLLKHKNGSGVPVFSSHALLKPIGQLPEMFCIDIDLSERRQAQEKLQLAASVFTHAREGILITDADGKIVEVNEAFTRITGYSHEEVIGRDTRILKSGQHEKKFYSAMWRDLLKKGQWYGEMWNKRKSGEIFAVMQTISAVRDAQGRTQNFVALFSDITAIKEHERQLEHIAHFDALTTLPNRVLLADRLQQAMTQARRRGRRLAVAYLDMDGFKTINDRHGHEVGDQLLIALAARMKLTLRQGDTLARMGGDEFVAVLPDLADIESSVPMISRLLAAASHPETLGDHVLHVSASVGVTFYPQTESLDADQLLRQADQAMYQAKLAGKNRYHIFDAEQDRSVRGHHESLEHIRRAIHKNEFVLHYQPKVNMRTGEIIGAEALIRWQHPERGLLAPEVFLPVIEFHPLAVELGEWVISTALNQNSLWRAAGLHIPVSVNLSARHLQQVDFVQRLQEILSGHPTFRPGDLELEVLETSALEDLIRVSQLIEECGKLGVSFALDDFGTGYSSLTYLKRLPVTLVKIDQSFVRDILDDPEDLAILQAMLGLSAVFHRQIIAEGAETAEHCAMLLQLGCDLAQGFGIAHPMRAEDIPGWAATWRPNPAWMNFAETRV